jgi:hypothetical protein
MFPSHTAPSSTTLPGAAQTDRAAAAKRAYNRSEPHGYPFVQCTVESYGRLGKPALRLLAGLGQDAADSAGGASKSGFVAGAVWELRVGVCRGNLYVYQDGYGLLAGALGHRPGMARPMDEAV